MTDDTIQTKALKAVKPHLKLIAHFGWAAIVAIIGFTVANTKKQMHSEALEESVSQLVEKMDSMNDKVTSLQQKQAVFDEKLDRVHEDVRDFKDWKDKVTGVAETVTVPKLGHRAKH